MLDNMAKSMTYPKKPPETTRPGPIRKDIYFGAIKKWRENNSLKSHIPDIKIIENILIDYIEKE